MRRTSSAALVAAIAFAALAAIASGKGLNTAVCTPFTDNGGRDFPQIPDTFTAKYVFFSRIENATWYIDEYYSEDADIGVLFISDLHNGGITIQCITMGSTGEQINIANTRAAYDPDNCEVLPLDGSNQVTFPFKPSTVINSTVKDTLVSGKTVLMFGASDGLLRYNGTRILNGIDVDVWIGCLYDSSTDLTFLANFYFSRDDSSEKWNTASGVQSIKRVDVVGTDSQNISRIDLTYDYILFDTQITDADWMNKFEPPEGSVCRGRASVKALPKIPNFFSFQAEILDPFNRIATYTDEWYDFFGNYSRMDYINYNIDDPTAQAKVVNLINDFTTGLTYQIDPQSGSCVVSAISPDEFDSMVVGTNLTRMRTPQEFFGFDGTDYPWYYNGRRTVRDIAADLWVSYRPFPTKQSSLMAVWEWYFSADSWRLVDKNLVEVNEPLRLTVTAGGNVKLIYNIYRFNEEEPGLYAFDVSTCFDAESDSRSFEMVVQADVRKYNLDRNVELLSYFAVLSLEAGTQVRALRVQDLELEFADTAFLLRFSILGPAPMTGDVGTNYRDPPLGEAVSNLQDFIRSSRFVVPWITDDMKNVFFTANPDSLVEISRSNGGKSVIYIQDNTGTTPSSVILSSGGAAGLALGMLVVGFLFVWLPYWFVWRRRK